MYLPNRSYLKLISPQTLFSPSFSRLRMDPKGSSSPCGACKFLRRKCVADCVFAPHFLAEHGGAARFASVHRVFGASNASKMLARVPVARRAEAVMTICYEAQARLADPVYGCVAAVLALQHQVTLLQAELSILQSQLIHSRLALTGTHQTSQQFVFIPSSYSNTASVSNNATNLELLAPGFDLPITEELKLSEEEDESNLIALPQK
ncbi:hypothetical protein LUZ63_006864 [Rhynchospora breviuscula]|uniref:LOB domain-containing protein n=1 Tax=Rhynchospora breviuscula TaxID=2022672 RepID=A0A9Q0HTY4_9POAL|nr:hypothetical protein LUZ63_006864 [Rhynchospora breviuscula]